MLPTQPGTPEDNGQPVSSAAQPAAADHAEAETLPPAAAAPGDDAGELRTLPPRPAAEEPVESGSVAAPGYEILGELGRGGMGVVYKARHLALNRLVALKMILAGGHAVTEDRRRFVTEAEAVARLQHPNIVQIYEIGESEGRPFFSLEFCAGGSLAGKLDGTPLPAGEAARLVETLARAMHAAHQAGVVHRDLKPANVLLTEDGTPKVTDFGLAKKLDEAGQTASGAIMGTPSYMAPEQAGGKGQQVGPAADVYALGAILYECLTGRPPFKAATALDTVLQVVSDEPVPPSRLQSKVQRDLETICLRCLHKEPGKRYASAADLAEDLQRFQKREPIRARPVGAVGRTWRWCRRNPAVAALVVAVAAVLLLGAGVSMFFAVRAETRARIASQRLYISDMRLAQQAWEGNQVPRLIELLDGQRPERTNGIDLRGFEWYYWRHCCHTELVTLKGHSGQVASVCYSPDGTRLASGSFAEVKVWDAKTGQEQLSLRHSSGSSWGRIAAVCFSPDGTRLASAAADGTVKLWDSRTGREQLMLRGHTGPVGSVTFSADCTRLATASDDRTVRVWDARTGQELLSLKDHAFRVRSVCFSPDGSRLARAAGNDTVRVWDAKTGGQVFARTGCSAWFSPDGTHIYTALPDGKVKVWDVHTGEAMHSLKIAGEGFSLSPNGSRLASASLDLTVQIWDAKTGERQLTLKGHTDRINCLCFSPDGTRLASASNDGTVKVWDAQAEQEVHTLKGIATWVTFSPDGAHLASGGDGVRVWSAKRGQEAITLKLEGHTGAVRCGCFSPDGSRLATGSTDRTAQIWDAHTGQQILSLQGHARDVDCVCFSPDGTRVASASLDGTVRVWGAQTGHLLLCLQDHDSPVNSICFSPDGTRLAIDWADQTVKLWDASTGQEQLTLKGHTGFVNSVCFSPDGSRLASASLDKTVKVWDAKTGQEAMTLKGHAGSVSSVCFSPDGTRLASASFDGTVKVWDAKTGQEVLTLKGHGGPVYSVCFSPDGTRLVSALADGTVKLWDAPGPESRP